MTTKLENGMKTHVMRNDDTGEVKFVKCDNEFIAYDFCVDYYGWTEDHITFMYATENEEFKPNDIIFTERRA